MIQLSMYFDILLFFSIVCHWIDRPTHRIYLIKWWQSKITVQDCCFASNAEIYFIISNVGCIFMSQQSLLFRISVICLFCWATKKIAFKLWCWQHFRFFTPHKHTPKPSKSTFHCFVCTHYVKMSKRKLICGPQ